MCCRLKTGKREEGEVFGSIPSLSHLTSQTQKDFSTALIWESEAFFFSFQFAPLSNSLTFLVLLREYRDYSSVLLQIPAHGGWGAQQVRLGLQIEEILGASAWLCAFLHLAFRNHTVPSLLLGNWFYLHSFSSNCSWKLWIMAVLPVSDDTFLPVTSWYPLPS